MEKVADFAALNWTDSVGMLLSYSKSYLSVWHQLGQEKKNEVEQLEIT